MSNTSTYAGVHWTKAELVEELEVVIATNKCSLLGSKRSELRRMYARRESILLSVLRIIKESHDAAREGAK